MKELINWLRNPRRNYTQGVTLFESVASPEMKKKYLAYFKEVETPGLFDPHFTMLINKLSDIERKSKLNPAILSLPVAAASPSKTDVTRTTQTIPPDKLPEELLIKYKRIQEIIPLMAKIHAELSDTSLTDESRKVKATELCGLEEEKISLWADIDAWSGHTGISIRKEPVQLSKGESLKENFKIARRISQLKENIVRAEETAKKAKSGGKKNVEANALNRLTKYRKELNDLEEKLKNEK